MMSKIRFLLLFSLAFAVVGCGSTDDTVTAPAEQTADRPADAAKSMEQIRLVSIPVWGRVVRDVMHHREFLNLDATVPWDYDDVVDETGPGGEFAGWQIATEADLQALGQAGGIVHMSTDVAMLERVEALRDWFGNVRLSTTHHYTRGLVSDQVIVNDGDIAQKAFGMGRRFNVEPNEVDFRVSGWGPISLDESTYLVRAYTPVHLDIKPGSCPNPVNPQSRGVLPAALLGTEEFDVHDIDASTLALAGVAPLRVTFEDVGAPTDDDDCACSTAGPDGFTDMTLKFRTQDIVEALGTPGAGETVTLAISGFLQDGTPFEAEDCVVIVGSQSDHAEFYRE